MSANQSCPLSDAFWIEKEEKSHDKNLETEADNRGAFYLTIKSQLLTDEIILLRPLNFFA